MYQTIIWITSKIFLLGYWKKIKKKFKTRTTFNIKIYNFRWKKKKFLNLLN